MNKTTEFWFDRIYWLISLVILSVVILRCALVPFSHDEVATFLYYIQPGRFWPFFSHPDANGHFLINVLGWISFKIGGSQPLVLRLSSILGFVVLAMAVSKFARLFKNLTARIILSSAFLLSYNFISFFSLCRGYGLSMSLLLFGLYYFFTYQRYFNFRHFFKFVIFSQLALSSNLTLVPVLGITTVILVLFQLKQKVFFKWRNILLLFLHAALTFYWIKYGFYLKEQGALYYGGGESYWTTTFRSLIDILILPSRASYAVVLLTAFFMLLYYLVSLWKKGWKESTKSFFFISFSSLLLLTGAFWMMKLMLGINYPEDRTGLFFYLFFIINASLLINETQFRFHQVLLVFAFLFAGQFLREANFRAHPWRIYETMPRSFYKILLQEQEKSTQPLTVGGHRVREFFYGFLNYNSKKKLSHMSSPEALQMNADYALAYSQDKPWYDKYYTEIAREPDWGFRLLKRRQPIKRHLLHSSGTQAEMEGSYEYINAFEKLDTSFNSTSPLVAEFELSVTAAPVPWEAWLVLQVDDSLGLNSVFIRTPLNLVKYDWNGTSRFRTVLLSPDIPLHIKRIVAYVWNIRKEKIHLQLNSFHLYQIEGAGIHEISKANI